MKTRRISGGFTVRLQTISLLLALFVTIFFVAPAHAQDDGNTGSQAAAQQILADVNQARVDNGLPPLAVNDALTQAAQRHVDDVIANGNWGHYGSDGSNVQMRVARAGYGTSAVSENWVAVSSPEQAIVWWMNDWIHRVNILGGHWDEIGVGAGVAPNGFWIFVTDFGNPDGGPPVYVASASASEDTGAPVVMSVPAGGLEYAVQPGDTLLGIAIRYGLDWQDIAIANNLGEFDLLQIGQVVHVPSIGGIGGPVETTATTIIAGKQRYTVAAGDTLFTIALRYSITWQEIAAVNGLQEYDLLQIGQEIALPASLDEDAVVEEAAVEEAAVEEAAVEDAAVEDAAEAAPAEVVETAGFTGDRQRTIAPAGTYTVRAGDTPLGIALSHSIALDDLLATNDLTASDFLQIGQTLTIPGAGEPETPATEEAAVTKAAPAAAATYTIRRGDTVFAVALRLGVDWQEMLRINNLTEQSLLQPGQTLVLP